MELIQWKDEYSVGIEKLDNQHKHMFDIINKFTKGNIFPKDSGLLSETLKELADYAREHFSDEEKLMQKYDFPELEPHKWQHEYFITVTAEFYQKYMHGDKSAYDDVAEFLNMWLTTHILNVDMKYKVYFKSKIHTNTSITI